jgi:hypothetical protein
MSAALGLFALQACAQTPTPVAKPLLAKAEWTVSAVSCPAGCPALTRKILQNQLGKRVVLDDARFDAPFVDPCAGSVRYVPRQQAITDVLAELRRTAPPDAKPLTPASLGFASGAVLTTASALCREAGGEMSYQRLLSIEPTRVQVLFEEQSVIELR